MQAGESGSGGTELRTSCGPVTVAGLAKQHGKFLAGVEGRIKARAPVWYPEITALHAVCRALILASKASKQGEYSPLAREWAERATVAAQLAKESREG